MSNLRRAMRLLEILVVHPDGVRITELADALGVNRAVPHRLLTELAEMGYVRQDPVTERYLASFKLGALGIQQLERAGIGRWSQAALTNLAESTRELVRLAVATDNSLRWVAKAQGSNSALIVDPASGAEVVLYATASGKAWLATLPRGEAESLLRGSELVAQTNRTETDVDRVMAEIDEARARGYALVSEEMDVGINAIAAPIVPEGGDGRAVGTVSIAGPSARVTPDVLVGLVRPLQETARELARQWPAYVHLSAPALP